MSLGDVQDAYEHDLQLARAWWSSDIARSQPASVNGRQLRYSLANKLVANWQNFTRQVFEVIDVEGRVRDVGNGSPSALEAAFRDVGVRRPFSEVPADRTALERLITLRNRSSHGKNPPLPPDREISGYFQSLALLAQTTVKAAQQVSVGRRDAG